MPAVEPPIMAVIGMNLPNPAGKAILLAANINKWGASKPGMGIQGVFLC